MATFLVDLLNDNGDPRVMDWAFMSSPMPTILVSIGYIVFVTIIGPAFMKSRKPVELRNTLVYYNATQVLFSGWICYQLGIGGWFSGYSFRCQPMDHSEMGIRMANAAWWYYISKFTEFFDTLFFLLRKKDSQITALHVIHHGVMPTSAWVLTKVAPGGHATFFALLNTFVHVVMYTYYMLAAMGPKYAKYIWWKKYLTRFQMAQFAVVTVHTLQLLFSTCTYPLPELMVVYAIGGHGMFFFGMFLHFYISSYKSGKKNPVNGQLKSNNEAQPGFADKNQIEKRHEVVVHEESTVSRRIAAIAS